MIDVGKKIQYFRERKGITVNKLANLSGVSQSYVRDLELGKKQPTVEYLSYICDGLGITLSTFFESEVQDNPLQIKINELSDEKKQALLHLLDAFDP